MKQISFNHPEELVALWPDVQAEHRAGFRHSMQPWWQGHGPKVGRGMNNGPGYGVSFPQSPRAQHVIVKAMPTWNRTPTAWGRHGLYLQREGATTPGEIGRGFNGEHRDVDFKTQLLQWQRAWY